MQFTAVFECDEKDKRFHRKIVNAHMKSERIDGAFPRIIATGDQVTVPSELVIGIADIDPENIDRDALAKLVADARAYLERDE